MKDRIAKIIQYTQATNAEFADKIGISTSTLSHIMAERNKPSLSLLLSIHEAYPEININWLLFGEGNMLLSDASQVVKQSQQQLFTEYDSQQKDETLQLDISTHSRKADRVSTKSATETDMDVQSDMVKENDILMLDAIRDKASPRITEIRVFYDNGTFQVFRPER